MLSDPIAALATPPGRSALAVVRVSGRGALEVAARVVEGFRSDRPRVAILAVFHAGGEALDRGLYTVYPAPHSYTGEDLVELSCHGGQVAPARLLAALHAAGARPATPGEFTRRAVINGKLDLVQAEAVGDLIDAVAPAQARVALRQLDGGLSRRLAELREALVSVQALLSYEIDFPGEDDGPVPPQRIAGAIGDVADRIDRLLATAPSGRPHAAWRASGARRTAQCRQVVALQHPAGRRPGPGDRDPRHHARRHRGTHRLPGLAGAAGGHSRSLELRGADRADGHRGEPPLSRRGGPGPALRGDRPHDGRRGNGTFGRASVPGRPHQARPPPRRAGELAVSAVSGEGIDDLRRAAADRVFGDRIALGDLEPALAGERHRTALTRARAALADAALHLVPGGEPVLVSHHIREATLALDELLGAVDVEEVLGRVFAGFCVGK